MAGVLELHTSIRPEAKRIVGELRQRGLTLYIVSGDHDRATRHLAEELGIGDYFAETLPEDKADHISRLQSNNRRVCFVGDGINDAIALKTAHVSVSLKGASGATLLVWRQEIAVYHRAVDPEERRALALVSASSRFGVICDALSAAYGDEVAAARAFAWLSTWISDGLLAVACP